VVWLGPAQQLHRAETGAKVICAICLAIEAKGDISKLTIQPLTSKQKGD
jgi:hypothetical protein